LVTFGYRSRSIFVTRFMFRLRSCTLLTFLFLPTLLKADESLAVIGAGVQSSEDAPFVQPDYRFQPGEFVYTTFQIAGFQAEGGASDEKPRKVSMTYAVTAEDANGVALCPSVTDKIQEELNAEDKNWTPKRRASFLIPSFVAAGDFQIHIAVRDLIGKTETSKLVPFKIGGVTVLNPEALSVQNFQFFRRENDRNAVEVPAYNPGDSVFVRFIITGFKVGEKNAYDVSYQLLVTRPDGKPYLDRPDAAELASESFYPARYLPGEFALTTSRDSPKGTYIILLRVRDKVANASKEIRFPFTIE
jgi:hypothetical protein